MEGSMLMECYEDVFEEIASKFYSDEPKSNLLSSETFLRFGSRLRSNAAMSLTMPTQYLLNNISKTENNNNSNSNNNINSINDDTWVESVESLSWTASKVAKYNPTSKMYKCVDCDTVGFLSRIAEHWLGAHANLKVFRCPRCPYSSAWARCVRMHLTRHHNEQHSDAALWKDNAALEEVTRLLHNLRHNAESRNSNNNNSSNNSNNSTNSNSDGELLASSNGGVEGLSDKRYACPQCPYATDRRDLYTRHENIHKDEKPFHCYICYKMFSRADHVKKHFFRMHKDVPYDIHLIRRLPVKSSSNNNNNNNNSATTNNNINNNNGFQLLCDSLSRSNNNNNNVASRSSATLSNNCRIRNSTTNYEARFVVSSKKRHLPKMFSCTYCSWRGVDNWCLKRHLNTHIKPYLCVLCDYKAARAERLSTHVLKIHNKRICNKCSFLAEDQIQLNRHARDAHHERHLIKCEDCAETFEGPSELETHGIMVHNKDLLDCDHCDFKTTHRSSLDRHDQERHSEESASRLQRNSTSTSSVKREFRCRECGCEFANQASLQTHLLLLHRSERMNNRSSCAYLCSLCEYGSSTQTNMMEHMRIHTGEVLRCLAEDCNFKTPFNSVLREHVEFIHDDDHFIIRCPHCGFPLNSKQTLAHHFPLHHPRLCSLCIGVVRKHFPHKDGENFLLNETENEEDENSQNTSDAITRFRHQSQVDLRIVRTQVKRSRKQSKPRKIIQTDEDDEDYDEEVDSSPKVKRRKNLEALSPSLSSPPSSSSSSSKCFSFLPQFRCRQCQPSLSFNYKKNWLLHIRWNHVKKRFSCEHCAQKYTHQYQVLLHASRDHVMQRL